MSEKFSQASENNPEKYIGKLKNYFAVLNLMASASEDDIKKSFRDLAKKYHPDSGGNPEKFIEIKEAYEVLKNPKTREEHIQQLLKEIYNLSKLRK